MRKRLSLILMFGVLASTAQDQSAAHILHKIQQLQNPLRVLYLAAHPDDENTRMIAWMANDIGAQTAYLSLTRGDGGQNLIGTELGAQLGVLRTQELMQARAIDGGYQFFSRAVDFGYSKNADETFEQWNRDQVLSDVVRVIRSYKPQIIITRFPPDKRAGHGHHTASAVLALEAFEMAAEADQYPEQGLEPWQVSRIFWNHSAWWEPNIDSLAANDPSYYVMDVGTYLPELGLSCNELASYSRSQHKSQGFGVSVARGSQKEYLKLMKGEPGETIFSGLPLSWQQAGYEEIQTELAQIEASFDPRQPYASSQALLNLLGKISASDPNLVQIRTSIKDLIADCLGLKIEVLSKEEYVTAGSKIALEYRVIQRSPLKVVVQNIAKDAHYSLSDDQIFLRGMTENELFRADFKMDLPNTASSQPYWLEESYDAMFQVADASQIGAPENRASLTIPIKVALEDQGFYLPVPVRFKFSDRVEGEIERPMMVVPKLTVAARISKLFFLSDEAQNIELDFRAFKTGEHTVVLDTEGWKIEPAEFTLNFEKADEVLAKSISIEPRMGAAPASLSLSLKQPSEDGAEEDYRISPLRKLVEIDYPHIDKRMILEDPAIRLIPMNLSIRGNRVAYIVGAGDKVPEGLSQMGYSVDILDENALREADLSVYQAIVLGIRAYNTQSWLFNRKVQLEQYAAAGGNVIVQYNTRSRSFQGSDMAPYPFTLSRERVTEEDAKVRFALPNHPILNEPNELILEDFDNWVQERGLYFASEWDEAYQAPLAWHDEGELDRLGGLIIANHGQGSFMYTGISFFRELPAGVPGAYRLLANMISYQHED